MPNTESKPVLVNEIVTALNTVADEFKRLFKTNLSGRKFVWDCGGLGTFWYAENKIFLLPYSVYLIGLRVEVTKVCKQEPSLFWINNVQQDTKKLWKTKMRQYSLQQSPFFPPFSSSVSYHTQLSIIILWSRTGSSHISWGLPFLVSKLMSSPSLFLHSLQSLRRTDSMQL